MSRCCERHTDWTQLAEHLFLDFNDVRAGQVIRELRRAKFAVEEVGLDESDALAVGELITRHQLLLLSGRIDDAARLDPERHTRV